MKNILFPLFIACHFFVALPIKANTLHFALFTQRESDDLFWAPVVIFAEEAAKQLNVKLTVFYAQSSKRKMLENVKKAKALNVDAIITPNYNEVALPLLELTEKLQIPLILFNADVTEKYSQTTGKPQQKFKFWLASIMPDDFQAGYLLGNALINEARNKKMGNEQGFIEVIAINGTITDTPAQQRLAGLQLAIQEDGNSHLLQNVHAFWDKKITHYKVSHLQPRHPNASVYWAASDLMAISAFEALSDLGLVHGEDFLTGGIDWTDDGLLATQRGQIVTSVGGHFMEGAWAVIMLFDYFNGIDIEQAINHQMQSPMQKITRDEIDLLLPRLQQNDWSEINFRQYTKFYNKKRNQYSFSAQSVLKQLKH